MIAKAVYIRDISPGQTIQDYFLLAEARTGTSRNGPYWSLVLQDVSGQMEAKVWSPLSQAHPSLSAGQKAKILEFLKQAREEAMDGVSANEKSAIFKKYKGRIANYLSAQGVDEAKARKEWTQRQHDRPPTD